MTTINNKAKKLKAEGTPNRGNFQTATNRGKRINIKKLEYFRILTLLKMTKQMKQTASITTSHPNMPKPKNSGIGKKYRLEIAREKSTKAKMNQKSSCDF